MKKLIEFADGITVEVDDKESGPVTRSGAGGSEKSDKTDQRFQDALARVKPIAEGVIGKLRDLTVTPDEVNVEFGVKLSAKAGVILASADSEANFKISLKWKPTQGKAS